MLHRCDKCGATTRWYDEKCPGCGAAQTVEIPTSPIALPCFGSSPTRRDAENVDAPISLTPRPNATPPTEIDSPQEKAESNQNADPQEKAESNQNADPQEKTESNQNADPQEKAEPNENADPQEKAEPNENADPQEKTESNQNADPQEKAESNENADPQEKAEPRSERARRFDAFWRAVAVWRSTFSAETASVTIPPGRAARYALGIAFEAFVCPPCAILAVYFFTRALFADRRAQYHAAMQETEKARRTLAVGLGVFAAFLCAFIVYVQSQEIAVPKESTPTSRLFQK